MAFFGSCVETGTDQGVDFANSRFGSAVAKLDETRLMSRGRAGIEQMISRLAGASSPYVPQPVHARQRGRPSYARPRPGDPTCHTDSSRRSDQYGICQRISITFEFEGVSAFFYEDAD